MSTKKVQFEKATTTPLRYGIISMPGIKSSNPMVQAQIDAAQKRREEEEREAAARAAARQDAVQTATQNGIPQQSAVQNRAQTSNAGVSIALAGLGAARTAVSTPSVPTVPDRSAYEVWEAGRKNRQASYAEEIKRAGGYYATLPQNDDFAALSAAREDESDPVYRYVHDIDSARTKASAEAMMSGRADDRAKYATLTDEEKKIYTYLYHKNGKAIADDYLGTLSADLDSRAYAEQKVRTERVAKDHPGLYSAASVFGSAGAGLAAGVDLAAQGVRKAITGEDINYKTTAQRAAKTAEDIRTTVSEEIESPVGQFFYNTGMSALDSLAAGVMGPVFAGVALGSGSGASTARDVAARGGSDGQALLAGVSAGVAEGLFEKFSIGEFKALKDVPVTGVKTLVGNVLKQMGVNASEELFTEVANILTDELIMGEMSNYRTSVNAYRAQGLSEAEAKKKAALDIGLQVAAAAASGAVMGGAFGAIGSAQSGIKNISAGNAIMREGTQQDVLDAGAAQVKGTESRTLADKLTAKQEAGKTIGRAEIGALGREVALQEERNRDALGNDLPMFDEASTGVRASAAALRRAGDVLGREVRFFRDTAEVGGYAEDGVVWLNVDTREPMAQVFAHEMTHTAENAGIYAELRQMALGQMDAGELSAAIDKKKKTYRDFAAKTDRLVKELDDAGAEAELVADYAATLFSDEAAIADFAKQNRNAAARVYERLREWSAGVRGDEEKAAIAKAQRVYAKALRETRGKTSGERQNLIGRTKNNEPIVIIERDILEGVPERDWPSIVKENLGEKFKKGLDVHGQKIKINSQTKKEITWSENTKWLRDNNKELYADKMRATDNADEIVEAAQDWVGEEPNHDRKGNFVEFARGTVLMRIGERDYTAEVVIGITKNGSAVLYDIVRMKRVKEKNSTRTESNNRNRSLGSSSDRYAVTPQSLRDEKGDRRYVSAFDDSIPQTGANGNTSAQDVTEMSHSGRQWSIAGEEDTQEAEMPLEQDADKMNAAREEAESQQRAEKTYQYMIDRMMERAANKDSFGDAYSGAAGSIGDLLRREAHNVAVQKVAEPGRAFSMEGSIAGRGITREMLNSRAAERAGKIENDAKREIGFALGMSYWADHAETDAAVERLVTQYLWNGQYAASDTDAQNRTNEAFDALFADAESKNRQLYESRKNIIDAVARYIGCEKRELRKKYGKFKRSGELEGFSESEKSIRDAYAVLQEQASDLFPERNTAEGQLARMLQIASGLEQIGERMERMETESGYLCEVMRAKVDFANAINDTLREAELVRRYAEDKRSRVEEAEGIPTDPADLVEISQKVKELRREGDRIAARYLFTEDDKRTIDRLMRGELKPNEVVSPNKAGILAVYEKRAEAEKENEAIRKYNARRRAQLDDLADTSMGNLDRTKDKASGIQYSTNTMERNVADVFQDKNPAKAVRENFFDTVHRATAAMTRARNAYNEKVAALKISQRVAKGNRDSEAYVVQLMGEAQDSLAQFKKKEAAGAATEKINGRTKEAWETEVAAIRAENPNMDWEKIDAAIGTFREIYNELFEQMNLVRVTNGYPPIDYRRGYFPHFQKNEPDTVFGKLLAGLGVQAEVTPLPTSINGLTERFKPGISWFGHAQTRTGFETDYDAIEGYERYIRGAMRVIYQTENIQRLRALERRIRYATTDDGMKERIKAKQAELDANETMSEDEKIEIMDKLYAEGRFTLSNFCNELSEYTNILAGKKSRLDRGMEAMIGRKAYNVLKSINERLGANMVSANIGSAMTNFIPIQQGYAELGAGRLMSSMWETVRAIASDDGFSSRSDFLINRRGTSDIGDTVMDRVSGAAGWMMETVDRLSSETLVRARYAQNIKAGLSQEAAMEEADRWAASLMGDRSMGAMPTIFHATNPVVKMFTQFQLEVANNIAYLSKDLPRDAAEKGAKEIAKIFLRYIISAFLFNELYEYFFGRRPAIDPLSWINEAGGDLTGYEVPNLVEIGVEAVRGDLNAEDFRTTREGIYQAAANLFKNVAEQTPFVGGILPMFVEDVDGRLPIGSAMPNLPNIGKALEKDRAWQDRVELAYKELIKPVAYLAMPFGGGQLKKAFEGIWAAAHGGSYTYNAQGERVLQYPIEADTGIGEVKNFAQAGLFGKSSFKTAREWVDSGFDSFSANETAIYRGLLDVGVNGKEAYAAVKQLGDIQKTDEQSAAELKRQALRDMTLSEDAKAVIYYGMLATEKEQALLDAFTEENFRTARAAMLLNDMRDAKTTAEERKMLADARGLGDVEKVMIYREKISTAWDDEIATMHEAGFSFDDFLVAQNALAECDEKTETKKERDNAFIDWAIGQGYKLQDRWVMMDCFGVSTEAKKDTNKKKYGLTMPELPQIKLPELPEIKLPTIPEIKLPEFGG